MDKLEQQVSEKLRAIPTDVLNGPEGQAILIVVQKQGPRPPKS